MATLSMPSTYQLKSRFQSLLRPLTARLYAAGITANQVTVTTCLLSVALGALLIARPHQLWLFVLLPAWLFVRMALNAVDGMLARDHGQASRLGAVLNEMGDVISDIALYAPFAFVAGSNPWLVAAILLLAMTSEFAGLLGAALGGERGHAGPMGKSDRALVFGIAGLLIGCGAPVADYLNGLWVIMGVLLILTIVNRCRMALGHQGQA